ncbi:LANO_0H13718g1_1 [Lachancea nothofagi CBS 11611]|uniref:Protein AF-9 homolog n=1 Tax=Lachancea nothofagi CBS 11611 TaxID=1266666 RepID=A0A1G4KML8_9SACH|nr:LANO_0H13718g1_1 [Lachancea nothofagi CBS 11611]
MAPIPAKRIKTLSVSRPIIYGNTAKKMGEIKPPNAPVEHTHMWTIFVKGPNGEDLSDIIKSVVYKLHETYPNPTRTVEAPPFELTETGWGEFEINVKINFVDSAGEKTLSFYHHLRLHKYHNVGTNVVKTENDVEGSEVESIFYDEVVFNEPNEDFFKVLMAKPGYLLPSNKTDKIMFSKQLEREEIDRIKIGIGKVDEEIDALKETLAELIQT